MWTRAITMLQKTQESLNKTLTLSAPEMQEDELEFEMMMMTLEELFDAGDMVFKDEDMFAEDVVAPAPRAASFKILDGYVDDSMVQQMVKAVMSILVQASRPDVGAVGQCAPCPPCEQCPPQVDSMVTNTGFSSLTVAVAAAAGGAAVHQGHRLREWISRPKKKMLATRGVQSPCTYDKDRFKYLGFNAHDRYFTRTEDFEAEEEEEAAAAAACCCRRRRRD